METRANYVWVGAVTLALIAALAAFILWLAQLGTSDRKDYDIFFAQSVAGLANGSDVSFSGVPIGTVREIDLWEDDPQLVRVRISVRQNVPILVGTTAAISSSFTGLSTINLEGARRGAAPITCATTACPNEVPVIPTKPGGFGEILASAPVLLERLTTLTERLARILSPENERQIQGLIANTNRLTGGLADTTPQAMAQLDATLLELRGTLAQGTQTLARLEQTLASTDTMLNREGASLADEMRQTLAAARQSAAALEETVEAARPAAEGFTQNTLPAAEATLRDVQRTSRALRNLTERIQDQGAGSLVRGTRLPDYEP